MIKKYVLDPQAVTDAEALGHFVKGLGVANGRLLAEYPKKWRVMAWDLLSKDDSSRAVRIARAALESLGPNGALRTIPGNLPYDRGLSWVENAANHAHGFAAAVFADGTVEQPPPKFYPVSSLAAIPEPEYWHADGSAELPDGFASTLVSYLVPLLELEPEVAFMDPYFAPSSGYGDFIREVLRCVPTLSSITLHSARNDLTGAMWRERWLQELGNCFTEGLSFTIVRWRERENFRPHPRFVVNSMGGINVDRGFESLRYSNSLQIQTAEDARRNWHRFGRPPWSDAVYDLKDVISVDKR